MTNEYKIHEDNIWSVSSFFRYFTNKSPSLLFLWTRSMVVCERTVYMIVQDTIVYFHITHVVGTVL